MSESMPTLSSEVQNSQEVQQLLQVALQMGRWTGWGITFS